MAVSFVKYVWAFRALLYKCRFAHVGKWTYIGKPVFLFGTKGISL